MVSGSRAAAEDSADSSDSETSAFGCASFGEAVSFSFFSCLGATDSTRSDLGAGFVVSADFGWSGFSDSGAGAGAGSGSATASLSGADALVRFSASAAGDSSAVVASEDSSASTAASSVDFVSTADAESSDSVAGCVAAVSSPTEVSAATAMPGMVMTKHKEIDEIIAKNGFKDPFKIVLRREFGTKVPRL
ncbi:hypothetical protein [Glutamicibacter nicotianae]|uniref:hypothetical protein n=1 Tax=Glutamicibacter nicotianae TaxID=37929 RepID=UPI00307A7DB5